MIALLWLAAAQAGDSSLPAVRAEARAPLVRYLSRDDYPASARARGEEGSVAVTLAIGADGRVMGCDILAASASSTLANTTCRLLRSRARFTPAQDSAGNSVGDSGLAIVGWSLAAGPQLVQDYLPATALVAGPPVQGARSLANLASYISVEDYPDSARELGEQGTVRFALDVGAHGRPTSCRITGSSGSQALDSATCRIMVSRARFAPAIDAQGHPMPDTFRSSITWRGPERPPSPLP